MAKRSPTDKAIHNLIQWAQRAEWADAQEDIFDSHMEPICKHLGCSREELAEEVEEELTQYGLQAMLFGVMFEDFASRRFPPDDRNVIDDYLKRRGWRESVTGRRYLQQLRDSVLSLYEVVDVKPGHHCQLRDLLRDGLPFRVHERMGTQNLVKWDRIAARVLVVNGKRLFSGGILPFKRAASESLLRAMDDVRKGFRKELSRVMKKMAKTGKAEVPAETAELQLLSNSGPAFTSIWLVHTLEQLRQPLPELVNRDGDTLEFHELHFPFLVEQLEQITQRLNDAPDWEVDDPDEHSWVWLPEPDADLDRSADGMAVDTLQDGLHTISGTLRVKPGALIFSGNSMQRARRGQDLLEKLLSGLIGPALSKIQTPEQLMQAHESQPPDPEDKENGGDPDPTITAEMIQQTLDQHYRQCLDAPIPALDNKTPRQCSRSKKGREKVIDWLKELENMELHRAASQDQSPYDSLWMWEELKLTQYRE